MYASAVADAGGLLTAAGVVEGLRHEVGEYVALDTTTLLLAEFLLVLHEGAVRRAVAEYAQFNQVVREWFPIRALAIDAALRAPHAETGLDSWVALTLAEVLGIPLVTKNDAVSSKVIPVLHS